MPRVSIQALRDKRRRAEEWVGYARWTAMITAGLGAVLVLAMGLSDLDSMPLAISLLGSLASQGAIGYKLSPRTQWAAWGLMITYLASVVISVFVYGIWSGIVPKAIVGYVYVRGFLATLDHEELTKQIDAASAAADAA